MAQLKLSLELLIFRNLATYLSATDPTVIYPSVITQSWTGALILKRIHSVTSAITASDNPAPQF